MRRIYAAIVLLVIAGLLCATEYICIVNTVNDYTSRIDKLESMMYDGEISDALEYSDKINREWYKVSNGIDMLLYHDYVDNISVLLESLPDYIEYGDYSTMHATCKQAKKLLISLRDSEYPTLQNII